MPDANFLEAITSYESVKSVNLDAAISTLDAALLAYRSDASTANLNAVTTAFTPIAAYSSSLVAINEKLQTYINTAAKNIADSDPRLIDEERYSNRIHPEEAVMAREATYGFIPELSKTSLPYLISVSVFMATLSIFLIFHINGFVTQVTLPPTLTAFFASPAEGITNVPFYKNPMVLGGVSIILLTALVIFIVLYFQAKNTNKSRQ